MACSTNEESTFDNLTPNDAAKDVAQYLTSDLNAQVIIGADSSARTEVVYNTLIGTDTLMVSPAATSDRLKDLDRTERHNQKPGLFWRTIPPDSAQAAALADYVIRSRWADRHRIRKGSIRRGAHPGDGRAPSKRRRHVDRTSILGSLRTERRSENVSLGETSIQFQIWCSWLPRQKIIEPCLFIR